MDRRSFLRFTAGTAAAVSLAPIMPAMALAPYTASHPLLLNQNENSLGMSPHAIEAAKKALALGHRYPDEYVTTLAADLARREGLVPQNIGLSNGSTGIIEAIIRVQAEYK